MHEFFNTVMEVFLILQRLLQIVKFMFKTDDLRLTVEKYPRVQGSEPPVNGSTWFMTHESGKTWIAMKGILDLV
jgi:hypothetical protein